MVKDMLSQIQSMSARSEKDVDGHHDVDDADNDHDDDSDNDDCDRDVKFDGGVSEQVNILASASSQLPEGDTQKQVNGCLTLSLLVLYFAIYLPRSYNVISFCHMELRMI